MSIIDIIILCILAFFIIKGLFRGIIIELLTLAGFLIGYVLAIRQMAQVGNWINQKLHLPGNAAGIIGFIIIIIVVVGFFRLLAAILKIMTRKTFVGWLDRAGGLSFGFLKGLLIASLLCLLITVFPFSENLIGAQENSLLFKPVRSVAPTVFNFLKRTYPKTKDFYEEVKEGLEDAPLELLNQLFSKTLDKVK
jgi:membrane protein required for colicin V production